MTDTDAPKWLLLLPRERIFRSSLANLHQGSDHAGGRLVLTSTRLVFRPARASQVLDRATRVEMLLGDLVRWGVAQPKLKLGSLRYGGLRKRLTVTTRDGLVTIFVVNQVAAWVRAIDEAVRAEKGRDPS